MFVSGENIEYLMYTLIFLSFLIIIVLSLYLISSKKNKSQSKKNMVNYDDLGKESKKDIKSTPVHLDKKELKKINTFKINSFNLFKANISKNNKIVSGNMKGSSYVLSVYDFFFSLQKFLNKLFIEGVYNIPYEDLKVLQKSIWSMNLTLFKNKLQDVNVKNGLTQEGRDVSDILFRKIMVGAIGDESYILLKEKDKEKFQNKISSIKKVLEKNNSEKSLTVEEREILDEYVREKEIQKEIQKILGKNIKVTLLSFNINEKELNVIIDYKNILDKNLSRMTQYYREKNNLNKINFYI